MPQCSICSKKNRAGHSRSHSNIASKRKFKANIQTKKVAGKTIRICTRCIKTQNKTTNKK